MSKLRPHQIEPARELLSILRDRNAVDFSDTGTGKTFVAAHCIAELGIPTLAVVPKIAQSSWHRAAAHFGDTISVVGYEALRTGRTEFGSWEHTPPPSFRCDTWLRCTVCQCPVEVSSPPCPHHSKGFHCVETKKKKWNYGQFRFNEALKFIVFDEVHRCSAINSLNADILKAARRQGIKILGLSATAANGPLQMNALGYAIDLHSGVNFYTWSRRFGCGKIPGMKGWHWLAGKDRQKEFMDKLHHEIFPDHGIRVRREDIPNFPKRVVEARLFDLDEKGKLRHVYDEMKSAMAALEARAALDKDARLAITQQIRFRERIDLLKVPVAVELAEDLIAKGHSVGIFCNFSSVIDELARRLKCKHIIDGRKHEIGREQVIDEFQADTARLVLINSEAGGVHVSLQDLHGNHSREGIVFCPQAARTFQQLCGRFQRDGALTPCRYTVLLAADTDEEKIHEKLQIKLANLGTLNDSLDDSDLTI